MFGREVVERDPEVGAVVGLLELVFVADCPIVEIANDEDMFCRLCFACCVCAEGNFCVVVGVVVDTVEYACGSVSELWCFGYAGVDGSVCLVFVGGGDAFEDLVAFGVEGGGVGYFFAVSGSYLCAVEQELQLAFFGSGGGNGNFGIFLGDGG